MRLEARKQGGMTLIEVVIAIVVIAIAVSAVLGVLARNVGASADAMIVSQGITIAEAYLEEISLKAFADPDGADGEIGRANFDDVDDYDGLVDAGAADQFGNPIPDLAGYTVSVAVNASSALPGIGAADAYRIDVRVQFASAVDYMLSGYRTRL
ncbi:MAG TPA: prepilin-type N-terminal cleavage/methylation domain-containing protein [Gammaproteobacteria bacterium]|nr:prepilin-type N-terminal cleavage/methylation domain-containing protein [Gammaproteobacteria bacterium]